MGKTRQAAEKALYQVSQLRGELSKVSQAIQLGRKVNPVKVASNVGSEYLKVISAIDRIQNMGSIQCEGLPPEISHDQIEEMLYVQAPLVGFFNGGKLIILPFAMAGDLNIYGRPTAVQPITYNGRDPDGKGQKLGKPVYVTGAGASDTVIVGGVSHKCNAALLYDIPPIYMGGQGLIPRAAIAKDIIRAQCDILGRINFNIQNSNVKLMFEVPDAAAKRTMENDLRQVYGADDPFVVLVRDAASMDNKPFQSEVDLQTQALFEAFQSLNSIRCMSMGVANEGAFEKRERKIQAETQSSIQTDIVLQMRLEMRNLWLAQMKLIYPEYSGILNKIKFYITRDSALEEEVNDENDNDNDVESDVQENSQDN